jgi:hypothetical protein
MVKKILLFLLVILFADSHNFAQFKKGMRMVGADLGSVFFTAGSSDVSYPAPTTGYTAHTTQFGLNIDPTIGWFISGHSAAGFSLFLNPTSNKTDYVAGGSTFQQDKLSGLNLGIGGFVRDYFKSSSSFMPFGQVGLNLGISNQKSSGFFYGGKDSTVYKITYDGKSSGGFYANAAIRVGLTKLLSPHTGLDISAGYTFSYSKNVYKTTTLRDNGNNGTIDLTSISNPTTKFTSNGVVLSVGFQVFLDPRK